MLKSQTISALSAVTNRSERKSANSFRNSVYAPVGLYTACGVQVKDGHVIKVSHLNTYVIGSYMEHRLGEKQIKTIAIVLRSEQATFSCVMCCDGTTVRLPAEHSIHSDHFNFEYGTATITCQIKSTRLTPTHVAITASGVSEIHGDVQTAWRSKVGDLKTNCDSNTQKVLDYYEKNGFVEIIPWTITKHINVSRGWEINKSPGRLHYFGQIPALNDCVYRYMYQSRYVALHDMDELILPIKVKTWTELLPQLEDMLNYEQDKWKNIQGVNILNYINRVPNPPNYFSNFKIIVNPRLVLKATVHGLLDSVNGKPLVWVSNSIAHMYHFKHFTYPPNTKLVRDDHLWDYANDLIPAVSKVLQASGLIEA
uniref:Glycosyltransferase family 92 protein n=1 Tax=Cyprinus carpio carpio TaxID=630221 RepID=A0A8C1DGZ6_CYPCA